MRRVQGERRSVVSYACPNCAYLVGEECRGSQPWRIFQLRSDKANDLVDVAIRQCLVVATP